MPDEIAIAVDGVTKSYRIWRDPAARLKSPMFETLSRCMPTAAGRTALRNRATEYYRDFFALRNVSFQIPRGESFGIIGRNGAGKSTLLQIIAGTLRPTNGSVNVSGRIAALLELGSGFNPEFTGIENVELNASILGLPQDETKRRLDTILAFADIGDFVHEPVKTYSSGMMVRLAFSVATHVDADLLLVDEALTVGDIFFQQKCYRRLEELKNRGTAIILVSHGLNDVEQFCSRALLLVSGQPYFIGPAPEAVKHYYLVNRETAQAVRPAAPKPAVPQEHPSDRPFSDPAGMFDLSSVTQINDGTARCLQVGLFTNAGRPGRRFEQGETACFYFEYELLRDIEVPVVGLVLFNHKGVIVHGKNSLEYGTALPTRVAAGTVLRFCQRIDLELQVDQYTVEVGIASIAESNFRHASSMLHPELSACVQRHCHLTGLGPFEVGFRRSGTPVQLLHHGIANLRGSVEILP